MPPVAPGVLLVASVARVLSPPLLQELKTSARGPGQEHTPLHVYALLTLMLFHDQNVSPSYSRARYWWGWGGRGPLANDSTPVIPGHEMQEVLTHTTGEMEKATKLCV